MKKAVCSSCIRSDFANQHIMKNITPQPAKNPVKTSDIAEEQHTLYPKSKVWEMINAKAKHGKHWNLKTNKILCILRWAMQLIQIRVAQMLTEYREEEILLSYGYSGGVSPTTNSISFIPVWLNFCRWLLKLI